MPRILNKIVITEVSAVDKPAQQNARAVIMKRAGDDYVDTLAIAKALVVDGISHGATQQDFNDEIVKRADKAFPSTLSPQQRFTKFVTETVEGKLLFKAMTKADRVTQAAQDFVPRQKAFGPNGEELNDLVAAMVRRGMSMQESYSRVVNDPRHTELVRRTREEERRALAAVTNSRLPIRDARRVYGANFRLGHSPGSARM